MAYCTSTELLAAISSLAQAQATSESGSSVDSGILTEVIQQSSDRMDLYLGVRYTVPVTTASALGYLTEACCNISLWKLLRRRLITSKNDIEADYVRTLDELKMIAMGDLSLPGVTETIIGSTSELDDFAPVVGCEDKVYGDPQEI